MTAPAAPDSLTDRPLISLRGVSKSFGDLVVLDDISLDFEPRCTTVVIGPSGVGKSVMLKIIVGLLPPDRGEVWFENQRLDDKSEAQLAETRTAFGFLFQLGALFDSMTVQENVCFPLKEHASMSYAEQCERASEVLHLVDMDGFEQQYPANLSGGQRKRVALARAIALHPRVIFYDEPTTGLDPVRSDEISDMILRLQEELSITSIVVTHDMTSAYKIADRIIMLYDGRAIADGTPDEIRRMDHPRVRHFVEGRAERTLRRPEGTRSEEPTTSP
jgi:phospholipid/cholesterol/gamma-HCH transport system ATP-binding protein